MAKKETVVLETIRGDQNTIVEEWIQALESSGSFRSELTSDQELHDQCREFLDLVAVFLEDQSAGKKINFREHEPLRRQMEGLSRTWADIGFNPSELTGFVTLLKKVLISRVAAANYSKEKAIRLLISLNDFLDQMGLWSAEMFQSNQQRIIRRQQEELMELSTPVISIWESVLVLPLIGTLDSSRTQVIMEALLERIVEEKSTIAILDITGVPTVDTMVAQHLLKAVTAARLMGAQCIISGIRPGIAQTMVQLGVDLHDVTTKANLADAFAYALQYCNYEIRRRPE